MEYGFFLFFFLGVGVLVFLIRQHRYQPCNHHDHYHQHNDVHRGHRGEMYIRGRLYCKDCGWETQYAIRIPDHITHTLDNTPDFKWHLQ